MVKRGNTAKFMPDSYVFPGGMVNSKEDAKFPMEKSNCDTFTADNPPIKMSHFPESDFVLRVAAARELFEECGLLLTADINCRESKVESVAKDKRLEEWRQKVKVFLNYVFFRYVNSQNSFLNYFAVMEVTINWI